MARADEKLQKNGKIRDYQWHGPMEAPVQKGSTKIRDYQWHGRNGGSRAAAVKKRPAVTRHRAPHKIRDYQWHGLSRRQKCAQNTNGTSGYLRHISG